MKIKSLRAPLKTTFVVSLSNHERASMLKYFMSSFDKLRTNGQFSRFLEVFLSLFAVAVSIFFTGQIWAETPRPDMSVPFPIQVAPGTALTPNMLGFFEHAPVEDGIVVKLSEGEFELEDYFVVQGATTAKDCGAQADSLADAAIRHQAYSSLIAKQGDPSIDLSKADENAKKTLVSGFTAACQQYVDQGKKLYDLSDLVVAEGISSAADAINLPISLGDIAVRVPSGVVSVSRLNQFSGASLSYYKFGDGGLKFHSFGSVLSGNFEKCKAANGGASPCVHDEEITAMAAADLDGNSCDDIVVASRKGADGAHANVYLGTCDDSVDGKFPFKYAGTVKIGAEPYDAAAIDGNSVLVTADPSVYKIGYENGAATVLEIPVIPPMEGLRPYQIAAVGSGACQGFATTWAAVANDSISFYYKFSVYSGAQDGACTAYDLTGHFEAPTVEIAFEGETFNAAMLSGIAYSPKIEEKDSPEGIWVGDQRIYKSQDNPTAAAYFYSFEDGNVGFGKSKVVATKEMLNYPLDLKNQRGGVKMLRVDKFGNLGVVLGYPNVWTDPPPEPEFSCPGKLSTITDEQMKMWTKFGDKIGEINEKTCYDNDRDCDGFPDFMKPPVIFSVLPPCDPCPPPPDCNFAAGKCTQYQNLQPNGAPFPGLDDDSNGIVDACDEKEAEFVIPPPQPKKDESCKEDSEKDGMSAISGSQKTNWAEGCKENDKDCDGIPDYYMTCGAINETKPFCQLTDKICDNCPPSATCKNEGECKTTANSDQKDTDGDGTGDKCESSGIPPISRLPIVDLPALSELTRLMSQDLDMDGLTYPNDPCECNYATDFVGSTDQIVLKDLLPAQRTADWMKFTGDVRKDGSYDSSMTTICVVNESAKKECAGVEKDGSGKPLPFLCIDPDGDKICNAGYTFSGYGFANPINAPANLDKCPFASSPTQTDSDENGTGDVCERDIDGDGVTDKVDNCPFVANKDQKVSYAGRKIGDACFSCARGKSLANCKKTACVATSDLKCEDILKQGCDALPVGFVPNYKCGDNYAKCGPPVASSNDNPKYGNYVIKWTLECSVAVGADKIETRYYTFEGENNWQCSYIVFPPAAIEKVVQPTDGHSATPYTGVDSDGDGIDDACDQYTLPMNHPYWDHWEARTKQMSSNRSFNFISEAYAQTVPAEASQTAINENLGQVTILINKSKKLEQHEEAVISDCEVEIGRQGYEAAGIGGLGSNYDNYIRDINDKIRALYQYAIKKKTGKDVPLESLNVDVFAGEHGHYKATCQIHLPEDAPSGWVLYQLGGMPLDKKYFGSSGRRPGFPPKEIQLTLSGGQTMTIPRDDFLKNTATRLLATKDTGGSQKQLGPIVSNETALDFMPAIVAAQKYHLVMPDTSASAKIVGAGLDERLLINIGDAKDQPLMAVTAAAGAPNEMTFTLEGYTGYDGGGWYHPDVAAPPPQERGLDPNDVLKAIKAGLDKVVAEGKEINYANVMAASDIQWDSTGFLNNKFWVGQGDPGLKVNVLINPLGNMPAVEPSGCTCNLKDRPADTTRNLMSVVALISLLAFLGAWRKTTMSSPR